MQNKNKAVAHTHEAGRGETDPLRPAPAADEPGRRITFETGWKALCDPLPKPEKIQSTHLKRKKKEKKSGHFLNRRKVVSSRKTKTCPSYHP